MDDHVRDKLRVLLAPPDRDKLLDDPRRLAELVRERLGVDHRREAGFLNAVLEEGLPKRLHTTSATRLSDTLLANSAKKISDDIGLKEEIARAAIVTWAYGLGLEVEADRSSRNNRAAGRTAAGGTNVPPIPPPPIPRPQALHDDPPPPAMKAAAALVGKPNTVLNILLSWVVPLAVLAVAWVLSIGLCRSASCDNSVNARMISIVVVFVVVRGSLALWRRRK
jgi:hypothetical protein